MDFLPYIFFAIHIPVGMFIDMRLWGEKEKDSTFVKEYFDLWLVYWAVIPFLTAFFISLGMDLFQWKTALIMFGMSAVWDLGYSKHEHGEYFAPLPYWFILPNPFSKGETWRDRRILIGPTTRRARIIFDAIRISTLLFSTTL